jgi:hypothetical protein
MGEYEDRYPEAYGRPADEPTPAGPPDYAPPRSAAAPRPQPTTTAAPEPAQAMAPAQAHPGRPEQAAPPRAGGADYEDRYPEAYHRDAPPPPAPPATAPPPAPRIAEGGPPRAATSAPPPGPSRPAPPPRPASGNDYEDRYPEAYRRDEAPPAIQQARGAAPPADQAQEWRDTRDLQASGRGIFGLWRHRRDDRQSSTAAASPLASGPYRGLGPRGYTRPDARIREDLCDRLSEDPHLDASDIEVAVAGGAITLSGTITDAAAQRRAQQHAASVAGVGTIRNDLRVR